MNIFISLLRGINVGGRKSMKMDALVQLFNQLGFSNAKTYIQSGNVVFSSSESNPLDLANIIAKGIIATFGFEVPVLVFSKEEFTYLIKNQPFKTVEISPLGGLHLTFLDKTPNDEFIEKANSFPQPTDSYIIKERVVYLNCIGKYSDSKFGNAFFESKLKVIATTRNWETCQKLVELF